jgi:hypothetical protein
MGRELLTSDEGGATVKLSGHPATADDLLVRLAEYEAKYGLPSGEMYEAFMNGRLHETPDFLDWSQLFETLKVWPQSD